MEETFKLFLLTVGYAKQALVPETRERARMVQYASAMAELHMIVFTRESDALPAFQQEGNLFVYGTNARTRVGMVWKAIRLGRRILRENRTKAFVVSSQDPFAAAVVGRAVACGNRATNHVQLHGDLFNPASYPRVWWNWLRLWYGRYIVRHTARIRVVSERIKRSLVAFGVPPERITVLPIQSNLADFLAVGAQRTYDPHKPLSFLYVGRFAPEKNLPLLLRSFSHINKQFPDARLTWVGAGPQQSTLETMVTELHLADAVTIKPWTKAIAAEMAQHDVFCLASDHEGWGMVLLEAAAAGMAIATTDVGCVGEVLKAGVHAFTSPVGNESRYTATLAKYCHKPTMVGQHGRAAHELAATLTLSEETYLQKLVDSFASETR